MMGAAQASGRWLVDPVLLLRRTLVVAMGYGAAVLVASAVTVAHLALPSILPDDGAWGSIHAVLREWPSMFLGGAMITAPSALPGFLAAVAVAAFHGRCDRMFFTIAGGLNALAALRLSGFMGNGSLADGAYFIFCCFGGGLAGGYAYWLIAVRQRPAPTGLLRRGTAG